MDRNQINNPTTNIGFANKDRPHSPHSSKKNDKKENKLKAVWLPVFFAFIACITPVLFVIIDWRHGVKLTLSKPLECKVLGDSLKRKTAELSSLKIDRNKKANDNYQVDSIKLEQAVYDLSQEIQKSKCD
jgi:hypothetical protein